MLFFLLLLVPATLHAGGNPEIGLPKVDRLIKERNYNEAILELAQYMQDNPEDFDGAQRRLKRIIDMRGAYNEKALELIKMLTEDPTNDEKKLEMITYLESLEKNPNQATQNFIIDTKAAAQFTYYRSKFEQIMNDGNALIDAGSWVNAMRKFQEGFTFYKQEFDDESDPALVADVNARIGEMIALASTYRDLQDTFNAAVAAFRSALDQRDPEEVQFRWSVLDSELTRFANVRNRIAANGWFFEDTFADYQKKFNIDTETSFLPFAYRFTLGRKASTRYEGILGAMDAQWNKSIDGIDSSGDATLRFLWTDAIAGLDAGEYERARANLSASRQIAAVRRTLASSLSRFTVRESTWGKRDYAAAADRLLGVDGIFASLQTLSVTHERFREVSRSIVAYVPADPGIDAVRKAPAAAVSFWNERIADMGLLLSEIARVSKAPVASSGGASVAGQYADEFSAWHAALSAEIAASRLLAYVSIAGYDAASAKKLGDARASSYSAALALFDGVPDPDATAATGQSALKYYPGESIIALNALRTDITADKKALLAMLDAFGTVEPVVRGNTSLSASVAEIQGTVTALDALSADSATLIARANSRVLQANLAKQESDLRYNQAKSALSKSDFQNARDNLQRSREKINVSLSYQANDALRAATDAKLETLGADITRIENESVVREVRLLISSGKNLYYLGSIDQAEQVFIQAKTRWGVTNVSPNPEVTNWLDIINTALSMKTGRTIPVSAPLYPQMSQILNTANLLYSDGKNLMEAGNRSLAVARLTEAKTKLQQLQLVYPLNQDAGTLTLMIDRLIDPEAFKAFFKQKIDYVRANYRTERQTAYSDLLDLYQINPSYPGIKALVDEVEIYLLIKLPPPDPKALARSSELTRAAQKIYDANTRSMFEVALDQLDEAIKLNPENQQAINLKDRVQTSLGGTSVAVLSTADEEKYQRAVQELQRGNKITASALVEQLLLNPKSKNSTKIQELKKRIDSQL
jgi:hypothetical protein